MLNTQQQTRLDSLKAKDQATLTSAEKREMADLTADTNLKQVPTVGYQREGSTTVYVEDENGKLVASNSTPVNVKILSAEDFDKKGKVTQPVAKPVAPNPAVPQAKPAVK